MAVSAIILVFARDAIAGLYTPDAVVRTFAGHLLLFAAMFQVADGLQVGAAGALRGFKDAKIPMLINVFSYWAVGFPLAYYFGLVRGYGADAVWLGLIVGLLFCAVLLALRYREVTRATA
jgi:MATE family multidrug resistance protein